MNLPKRDVIATALVGIAVVLYGLWAMDATLPALDGVRATGLVVLVLGFIASASAVVPSFDQLLHGNKAYAVVTSMIGLVAFAGGLLTLIAASETGLAIVMISMVVLWAIASTHHVMLAKPAQPGQALRRGPPTAAAH